MVAYRRWVQFVVGLLGSTATSITWAQHVVVQIDVASAGRPASPRLTASCIEDVNHEIYGGLYSQLLYGESFQEPPHDGAPGVSGMWTLADKNGSASIEYERPFVGSQSQRLTLSQAGEATLINRGLNRWGLALVEKKSYEGYVWLRSDRAIDVDVALSNADATKFRAQSTLHVDGDDAWHRCDFTLTPGSTDTNGSFVIRLTTPGSVVVGHAFLEPGEWGRFKKLPVRKDVADAMLAQGITALRYGGSMVNEPEYRWKKMIGPRDRRPPYVGHWYKWSSNGWGIVDFLNFCDAAGIDGTPDFCLDESPQDMSDFVDYALGDETTTWGRRRIADGRREPYLLKQIEIGNEERIDDQYVARFGPIADAIWKKYPKLVLVVGDFNYNDPITDPMHVTGADSKITSLEGQQKIMAIAKRYDAEVWFDVHINTENPPQAKQFLAAQKTYMDAIDSLADGAKHRVNVFELNANRHDMNRGLANAIAIGTLQRDGRLPMVVSANGLQPDGQNDNGWDQGLIFLNSTSVWLQPPGYAAQMISRTYEPITLDAQVGDSDVDVTACKSEDGKTLVIRMVNPTNGAKTASLHLDHFSPAKATRWELKGAPDAENSASEPTRVKPEESQLTIEGKDGTVNCDLPPNSFVVLQMQ